MSDSSSQKSMDGFFTSRPMSRKSSAAPSRDEGGMSRPMSKLSRLTSSIPSDRPTTTLRGSSGFRQLNSSIGRPPTAASGSSQHPSGSINFLERPVTQQGVSGLRASKSSFGNRRLVHDKSYFIGLLRSKMSEIGSESRKLMEESEEISKEHSTYLAYEKRVREIATQLSEKQGELSDLNIISDMIATGKNRSYIEEELKQVGRENKLLSSKIETIFLRKRTLEGTLSSLETQIVAEKSSAERLVQHLSTSDREIYEELKERYSELETQLSSHEETLSSLRDLSSELYSRISGNELKKRRGEVEEEWLEVVAKRDELLLGEGGSERETAEEEKERLSGQMKKDTAEIGTLERQNGEIREEVKLATQELRALEHEIEESESENQLKYRELRKREEDIDIFMTNFEESSQQEMKNLEGYEAEILNLLQKMTRNFHLASSLPESGDPGQSYSELSDDFEWREKETDKARMTTEMIEAQNERLRRQLDEFESLEGKLGGEVESLSSKIDEMKEEIVKFQDTERIKNEGSDKNSRLVKESKILEERLNQINDLIGSAAKEGNKIESELEKSDVWRQIQSLEKKLSFLEEVNTEVGSSVQLKKNETNYEGVRTETLKKLENYNTQLKSLYSSN